MKADSEFFLQIAEHLNKLDDEEHFEERENSNLFDPTEIIPSKDEPKVKLYENEDFKAFLKNYIAKKYNKKKEKITNKYSEQLYRKMYKAYVVPNYNMNLYSKIMYNPDVSITDYNYIGDKISKFPKLIIYNQIGLFSVLGYCYFKTSFGMFVKSNPLSGAIVLGLSPMTLLLGTQKLNDFLLNKKMRDLGLDEKYHLAK
jgi:hypothetical protein